MDVHCNYLKVARPCSWVITRDVALAQKVLFALFMISLNFLHFLPFLRLKFQNVLKCLLSNFYVKSLNFFFMLLLICPQEQSIKCVEMLIFKLFCQTHELFCILILICHQEQSTKWMSWWKSLRAQIVKSVKSMQASL